MPGPDPSAPEASAFHVQIECRTWNQFIDFFERGIRDEGMFVPTESPPATDAHVVITLATPDGTDVLVRAKVTSSAPSAPTQDADSPRAGMHIHFDAAAHEESRQVREFLQRERDAQPAKPAPPRPAEQQSTARQPARAKVGLDMSPEGLMGAMQQVKFRMEQQGDLMLFGLSINPTEEQIEAAYRSLSASYHPHRFARYKYEPLKELAKNIFVMIQDTRQRLLDAKDATGAPARRATRATLDSGRSAAEIAVSDALRLLEFNQYDGAEGHLATALNLGGDEHPIQILRCVIQARRALAMGDPTLASTCYSAVLELDPAHCEAREHLDVLGSATPGTKPRGALGTLKRIFGNTDTEA